jgi:hypothetical protein
MALSDEQIERYSRQIVVPGIGGLAQERLLGSQIIVAGDLADVEPLLAYLVGAGVGTIALEAAGEGGTAAPRDALIAELRGLNPDATVLGGATEVAHPDLVAIIIGSRAVAEAAARLADAHTGARFIVARLDGAGALALLAAPPPCPRCADGGAMLRPFGARASNARFIAMLAAAESLKLLAGSARAPRPLIVEFDGYRARAHPLRASVRRCACTRKIGERRAAHSPDARR